jgi:hypothetical protein
MSFLEKVDGTGVAAKISPRNLQRRDGDDKAASQHRRAVGSVDPLAAIAGLSSCHYKRRAADDKATAETAAAAVELAAKPPSPALSNLSELLLSMDRATPELRRRIFEARGAEPRERLSKSGAWSFAAGLSIPLCLGLGGLIFAF